MADAQSRSDAEYRWLFESAGIGNAEIRLDTGRFVRANRRYCQLTGYSEAELLGMTFLDITHPDDRAWNLEAIRPFMDDRTDTFEIEKRYIRKDGAVVWVHLTGTLIRDVGGKAVRLLGSAVDITERKAAEESLRIRTAQLNFALASTGVGLWLNTMPLGRLNWDDRTKELFFLPPGVEATAELFWSRLHPDDREPTRLAVEAAIRDHTLYAIDHRAVNPATGETRWIRSAGHATYAEDGSPVRFDGVSYDITERKRAEERALNQADRLREQAQLLDLAPVLVRDTDSRIVTWNTGVEGMYGFAREEAEGRISHKLLATEFPQPPDEIMRALFEDGSWQGELTHTRKDGGRIVVASRWVLRRDEQGRPWRILEVNSDITERKRAEEALRVFIDHAPVAIAMFDRGMCYLAASRRWLADFGFPDAPTGKCHYDVFPRPLPEHWKEAHRRGLAGEVVRADEDVFRPGDGPEQWLRWEVRPWHTGTGEVGGIIIFSENITERKRAEVALAESEATLRAFYDHAPVLMGLTELLDDGDVLHVYDNPATCRFFGVPPGATRGKRALAELGATPQVVGVWRDAYMRSEATGQPVRLEHEYRGPEGVRWLSAQVGAVGRGAGGRTRFCYVAEDVTDQRAAADALRRQTARATRLVESNIIGVIFSDAERITDANDAFLDMIGYSHEDVQAGLVNWRSMTPPEFLPADMRALEEMRQRGACTPFEKEYIRKDGSRVPILLGTAVIDPDTPAYVGFVQDLSRVKQVEGELRAADRRKDEFLATLAHELRNPLAPIRNAVQVLKAKGPQDPDLVWGRDIIDRQVGQMARLLDDLLDVSRITRNKLELRRSRVPLAVVIENALETSRPLIDQMKHQLVISLPPQPVTIDADTTRLAQVFSNLLNNAAKYSDPGSRIWLTAERRGSELIVSVRDTGIGIAGDQLRHVFEMFSQATPALERAQGGLGIGLSLVRGLVELHGGSVEARSEGPGQGSEFIVRLPVAEEPVLPTPTGRDVDSTAVKTSLRILVVDDNRDGAESLSMMLTLMGNETRTAYDGAAAVTAAGEFRPDVILLDIGLPKMSGYDVCRHIRREPWGKPVVIVAQTGWGQADDRQKASAAGFDHHFVKPVDMAALTTLLARLQPVNR